MPPDCVLEGIARILDHEWKEMIKTNHKSPEYILNFFILILQSHDLSMGGFRIVSVSVRSCYLSKIF